MHKHKYNKAVEDIKQAIARSECAKGKVKNAQRLELYLAVGGYLSRGFSSNGWKREALDVISERLQEELPGLRGFSPYNLALMCRFHEAWAPYLPVKNDYAELNLRRPNPDGSTSIIVWDQKGEGAGGFPLREFLGIGFTHHRWILSLAKGSDERQYYVRRCFKNRYSVAALKQAIRNDEYHHQGMLLRLVPEEPKRSHRPTRRVAAFGGVKNILACLFLLSHVLDYMMSDAQRHSQPKLLARPKAA